MLKDFIVDFILWCIIMVMLFFGMLGAKDVCGLTTPHGVTLAWDAPNLEVEVDGETGQIPLDGYRVYVNDGEEKFIGCETDAETTTCEVVDLGYCTKYTFTATAFNEYGESDESAPVTHMIGANDSMCTGTSSAAVEPDQEFIDEEDTNGNSDNIAPTDGGDNGVDGSGVDEPAVTPPDSDSGIQVYEKRRHGGCFIDSLGGGLWKRN